MKVGVWVKDNIDFRRGGAFSYQSKLVDMIDDYNFPEELDICFISSNIDFKSKHKEVIQINDVFRVDAQHNKHQASVLLKIPVINRFIRRQRQKKIKELEQDVRNVLIQNKVDVIYYPTQAGQMLTGYPFISTNWDIGHLSTYSFPEFSDKISGKSRISWYNTGILRALAVFTESESGRNELIQYTRINPDRVLVVPMFPGDIVNLSVSEEDQKTALNKFNLLQEKYFIYPAQFWPHKNHYNLIHSFKKFNLQHPGVKLVLSGSDKADNLEYIKSIITHENIKEVEFFGFVEQNELHALYKNAIALIMPTLLGPTNMPLLEALHLGCPVICSNFDGHKEQMVNAARYVDPLDQNDIVAAMVDLLDIETRNQFRRNGTELMKVSVFTQEQAIKAVAKNLLNVSKYRNNWSH